jgi:hypothetical protein
LAYATLNHIFGGNLTKPPTGKQVPLTGQFVTIEQPAFMNPEAVTIPDSKSTNIFSYWSKWLQESMATYKPSFNLPSFNLPSFNLNTLPTFKLPGTIKTPSSIGASGFDKEGYVYYPSNCTKGKKCPIHVALHGCGQGLYDLFF